MGFMLKEDYAWKREMESKIRREKVLLVRREYTGKGKYIEELFND